MVPLRSGPPGDAAPRRGALVLAADRQRGFSEAIPPPAWLFWTGTPQPVKIWKEFGSLESVECFADISLDL